MEANPHFWAGKRVCITGGTGFLGYHLVRQLLPLGCRLKVLALPPAPDHPIQRLTEVEKVYGDVRDAIAVRRAVADCDVVFHTAGTVAFAGPALRTMYSVHVGGTQEVLRAATPQATIVHTSSVVAVGASRRPLALDETSPFHLERLRIDYVHAKRAAETLALQTAATGRRVVVTNPAYLVGPEDHERSELGRICSRFWKGQLWLVPAGGFNFVDVRDVALGHLLAAERGRPGRRYILGGENHSLRSFFALLAQVAPGPRWGSFPAPPGWLTVLAGLSAVRFRLGGKRPYFSWQQACLHRYFWYYRSDRAARELGYQPRPLRESLADTHRWHLKRNTCQPLLSRPRNVAPHEVATF